jgi:hypothetical protein
LGSRLASPAPGGRPQSLEVRSWCPGRDMNGFQARDHSARSSEGLDCWWLRRSGGVVVPIVPVAQAVPAPDRHGWGPTIVPAGASARRSAGAPSRLECAEDSTERPSLALLNSQA